MELVGIRENEQIIEAKKIVNKAIDKFFCNNYDECINLVSKAIKIFVSEQSSSNISVCLSLMGVAEYLKNSSKYLKALSYINDAKYLANFSNTDCAKLMNEFAWGEIDYKERNLEVALLHYKTAKSIALKCDSYNITPILDERISKIEKGIDIEQNTKRDPLVALLKIGQTVAAETNIDTLLEVIAQETKSAIHADRCSVFLYDRKTDELWSKVALGMDREEIRFPATKGLAGHVVKTGETINIKDAYFDDRFNKEIDLKTGYKTETILCMPIKNLNHQIIGAFQVLNKLDGFFTEEDEDLLVAIGSSAGVSLENAQLFKQQEEMFIEQKKVFDSFIDTLATSIDARDKITAGHSLRVREYAVLIAKQYGLDEKSIETIEKAAILHDIGKIGIRDSVLQKQGKLTPEEYTHIQEHVAITHNILEKIHLTEEFKTVKEIACSHHEKYDGSGYYRKLKGEEIPLGGRILAVSDVFDAITSKRHYRDKMPIINVIDILLKDSGTHFDKSIADCFLSIKTDKIVSVFLIEDNEEIQEEHIEVLKRYSLYDLYNLVNQKSQEELTEEENWFINLFNMYYTAKSNKENGVNV